MKLISMTIDLNSKEYRNIHDWIRRRMSHIKICTFCGSADKLDNALKRGMNHSKNIDNYIKLCRKCHYKYDHPEGLKHSDATKVKIGLKSKERIIKNGVSDNFKYSKKGTSITHEHKNIISLSMSGENHHQSKLSNVDVKNIRLSKLKPTELAVKYNVSYRTINNILKRKTWKKLD